MATKARDLPNRPAWQIPEHARAPTAVNVKPIAIIRWGNLLCEWRRLSVQAILCNTRRNGGRGWGVSAIPCDDVWLGTGRDVLLLGISRSKGKKECWWCIEY